MSPVVEVGKAAVLSRAVASLLMAAAAIGTLVLAPPHTLPGGTMVAFISMRMVMGAEAYRPISIDQVEGSQQCHPDAG